MVKCDLRSGSVDRRSLDHVAFDRFFSALEAPVPIAPAVPPFPRVRLEEYRRLSRWLHGALDFPRIDNPGDAQPSSAIVNRFALIARLSPARRTFAFDHGW